MSFPIRPILLVVLLLMAATEASAMERRCGWYENPSPGNHFLTDRDASWMMAAQGGFQARGMDQMPDFTTREWVRTNGYYGYGCACMTVDVDARSRNVLRIRAVEQLPLSRCRQDRSLPRP